MKEILHKRKKEILQLFFQPTELETDNPEEREKRLAEGLEYVESVYKHKHRYFSNNHFHLVLTRETDSDEKLRVEEELGAFSSMISGWDIKIPGFIFFLASYTFEDAVIPMLKLPRKNTSEEIEYREESFYLYPKNAMCVIVSPVLRERKVIISLEIVYAYANDLYRKGFLKAIHQVENVIRLTRTAIQLVQAARTPDNPGFLRRAEKELFYRIAVTF